MSEMNNDDKIKRKDWRQTGFDKNLARKISGEEKPFISGADFDAWLDELEFNRVIRFKNLDETPQGNDEAKTYYDKANKQLKIWIDKIGKWAVIQYTTTSTSTTSTSTTSTSISTTSTSTTSTSTTSSSSSTSSTSTS